MHYAHNTHIPQGAGTQNTTGSGTITITSGPHAITSASTEGTFTDMIAPFPLHRRLPLIIKSVLLSSEGWLVGSSVRKLIAKEYPKDYDIIVPSRELFESTCIQLYAGKFQLEINSRGGLKFTNDSVQIDIWCEELDHFLKNCTSFDYAYCFKNQILISDGSQGITL